MDGSSAPLDKTVAELAEAHRRLLADGSIQFDLPAYTVPKPPEWLEPVVEAFRALAPYLIYFFWTMVIAGAAVILLLVAMELKGVAWRFPWQTKIGEEKARETWRPEAGKARILLSEADELAAGGHYDQAVHLLLRRSVEDIAQRLPDFLRPSLTARDIAVATLLPDAARSAFGQIARVVEAALFARRAVGVQGWQEARAAYERFAFRDSWA